MDATEASKPDKPLQKGFTVAFLRFLSSHVDLFGIEFAEAKGFMWAFFVHLTLIVICSILFFIFCSVGIVAYFWESYRLTAIAGLLVFYLIIIMTSLVSLIRLKKNTKLFAVIKEELIKDKKVFFDE